LQKEASVEALEKMMTPECTVFRDGEKKVIPACELVPGDVALLEEGDRVPEGLPAILTITLAFGVTAMARRNALIKRLPAADPWLHHGYMLR